MIPPSVHREAERLVRERKAPSYSAACAMIAKRRRNKPQQSAPRELRLPYRDD